MGLKILRNIFILLAVISIMSSSCKKDMTLLGGGQVSFSTDTVTFDTVFTAQGSFTTSFVIYNPQGQAITISSIRMLHAASSYFHLNIDGLAGNTATNLSIMGNDSAYVFATVDIDPTNANTPFLITDSLVVTLNGKEFYLPFEAYGQNAHYIVGDTLDTQTWVNDKPYVIIHSAGINAGQTLTIDPGCRIYMHQDSRLVIAGTLIAEGNKNDTILFIGDRLDRYYFRYQYNPGEWGGLYFTSYSTGSRLDYVRIENCGNAALGAATAAIQLTLDSVNSLNNPANPQLTMKHSIVQNSLGYGILNFGGTLVMSNSLINTTGLQALANIQGGFDSVVNCTFANYGSDHSQNNTMTLLNYLYDPGTKKTTPGYLSAVIRNCIVYGGLENELFCDQVSSAAALINFDHCLIKADSFQSFVQYKTCLFDKDPIFADTVKGDFHIKTGSPAIDAGVNVTLGDDLEGNTRPKGTGYDIGCYEAH